MLFRQTADIGHVNNVHCRICGRFKKENLSIRLNRRLPRIIVAAVDRCCGDAPFGQQIVREPAARAKGGARGNDMIAHLQLAQ